MRKNKIYSRPLWRTAVCLSGTVEDGFFYPLVKQQGQNGYAQSLYHIQRCYTQYHEGGHIGNTGIDSAAHGDDVIHRQTVKLGNLRLQINGIERGAK